jgi:hypothetical protein
MGVGDAPIELAALVPVKRPDTGPLEHQLAANGQASPQRRDGVQAGDDALDISRILCSRHGRLSTWIRLLGMLPSPLDIAERGEALGLRHLGRMVLVVRAQRPLALLLPALLSRPLARARVSLGGGDERAPASCSAPIHPVREAQLPLDDVVHEIVWDVVIVPGRWIHRARWRARECDDDRVAPCAGALERNVHRDIVVARGGARKASARAHQAVAARPQRSQR